MADRLLSAQEVADFLGIPLATLYQWRTKGTAPRAVKAGRYIRFRKEELDAWCGGTLTSRAGGRHEQRPPQQGRDGRCSAGKL